MNAKDEFLKLLAQAGENGLKVSCASLYRDDECHSCNHLTPATLSIGFTPEEYEAFLSKIDFEYDDGYGRQELYGEIWFDDEKSWAERFEYDGAENWVLKIRPEIPDSLRVPPTTTPQ